jgi:hypothetical protein
MVSLDAWRDFDPCRISDPTDGSWFNSLGPAYGLNACREEPMEDESMRTHQRSEPRDGGAIGDQIIVTTEPPRDNVTAVDTWGYARAVMPEAVFDDGGQDAEQRMRELLTDGPRESGYPIAAEPAAQDLMYERDNWVRWD